MDEIFKQIERSKALIAGVRLMSERRQQQQRKRERLMRRRSNQPVIRVVKKLEGSSAVAQNTLLKIPKWGGSRR